MPRSRALMRSRLDMVAHQSQINADRWAALPDLEAVAFLCRLPCRCLARHVHRADGGEFGHAPTVNDLHAQDILELLDHPLGTPGAAGNDPLERSRARP